MLEFAPQLIFGIWVTIQVALCALLFGLLLGLLFAIGELAGYAWLRWPVRFITTLLRGLPEIVILFFIYFGVSRLLTHWFGHYIEINAFVAGCVALGLVFASYAGQVFRAAITAIPTSQWEAAQALAMPRGLTFWRVILPQAWRFALPGLSNLWLVLLKDTSLVSLIGLTDLMTQTYLAASINHRYFYFYLIAALGYLLLTFGSSILLKWLTTRANRHIYSR
jgi:His/Glu/Gln/Arg/opine family amino acid ABC transporter permease subunit